MIPGRDILREINPTQGFPLKKVEKSPQEFPALKFSYLQEHEIFFE